MKRNLLQNVKVQPYTSGSAIDGAGFLSAILGAVIGTAGDLTITITHSDDGVTFGAVTDTKVFPEESSTNGAVTLTGLSVGDVVNLDIDLLGLKDYVKITASGTAATDTVLALAFGDAAVMPV